MLDHQAHVSAEAVAGQPAETLARPFQAARAAARLALPVASARLAAVVQPQAAGHAAAALSAAQGAEGARQEAAVLLGAAGAPQAEQHAEEVPQQAAEARVAVAGARDAVGVEVRPRAALPLAALPSVLLSAGPWAFRQGQAPPSAQPAPQPAARSAHAMEYLRIARPSALSWQVAKDEVWS
jgi:hypothetical protein